MLDDALTPDPPGRPGATNAELQILAAEVQAAEVAQPRVHLPELDIPLSLRVNGTAPYLAITSEIRAHLRHSVVDFDLTCRNDMDRGVVTWDLRIGPAFPRDVRTLLDWLVPVYAIQNRAG